MQPNWSMRHYSIFVYMQPTRSMRHYSIHVYMQQSCTCWAASRVIFITPMVLFYDSLVSNILIDVKILPLTSVDSFHYLTASDICWISSVRSFHGYAHGSSLSLYWSACIPCLSSLQWRISSITTAHQRNPTTCPKICRKCSTSSRSQILLKEARRKATKEARKKARREDRGEVQREALSLTMSSHATG